MKIKWQNLWNPLGTMIQEKIMLLPLRTIYFWSFYYEIPCTIKIYKPYQQMIAKLFDCLSLIFSKTLIKGYDRFRSTAIYLLRNPFESLVSTKGALALNLKKSFTLAQISKNWCQITTLSCSYAPKEMMPRFVIWHQFFEISAKVKNFLRLSHL